MANAQTIALEHIPEHVLDQLARSTYRSLTAFYEDPENQRRFEEWKAKRRAEQEA